VNLTDALCFLANGAVDQSPNRHNFTWQGSGKQITTGPDGSAGSAMLFDGSNWLTLAQALVTSGPMSFNLFYQQATPGVRSVLLMQSDVTQLGRLQVLATVLDAPAGRVQVNGGGAAPVTINGVPTAGVWHMLTLTTTGATGDGCLYYLDGSFVQSIPDANYTGVASVLVGGRGNEAGATTAIANAAVYGGVLTTAEITKLYNGGVGFNPFAPLGVTPIQSWSPDAPGQQPWSPDAPATQPWEG
jgi:hypothetical protein